jgi:hypothetical protein
MEIIESPGLLPLTLNEIRMKRAMDNSNVSLIARERLDNPELLKGHGAS